MNDGIIPRIFIHLDIGDGVIFFIDGNPMVLKNSFRFLETGDSSTRYAFLIFEDAVLKSGIGKHGTLHAVYRDLVDLLKKLVGLVEIVFCFLSVFTKTLSLLMIIR